jgi:hypothetical protein
MSGFGISGQTRWADMAVSVGYSAIEDLQVQLMRGNSVSGRVEFLAAAKPPAADIAPKTGISLMPVDVASRNLAPVPVSGGGLFTTAEYPAGTYVLSASPPPGWILSSAQYRGTDIASSPFTLSGNHLNEVVVTFRDRSGTVTGTVLRTDGRPDPDASVLVFPRRFFNRQGFAGPVHRLREGRTGETGTFSIGSVPPGEYFITAMDDRLAESWQTIERLQKLVVGAVPIVVKDSETQRLTLRVVLR